MTYHRERAVPAADLAGRLLDSLTSLEQETARLRATLTGPQLPVDERVLGKTLGRILAARDLLHLVRKELSQRKESA
jgi:hypothetical protein